MMPFKFEDDDDVTIAPAPLARQFASRDSGSGRRFERQLQFAMEQSGYRVQAEVYIGKKHDGTRHRVDFVVGCESRLVLVSSKWQSVPGSGENLILPEVDYLADALLDSRFAKAYVVICGPGWTTSKLELYLQQHAATRLRPRPQLHGVHCVDFGTFFDMCSRKAL